MTVVVRNATVITGVGDEVVENAGVLIENGVIADVGRGPMPVPDSATVLDAAGGTVLPGLINLHDHMARKKLRISEPGSRYRDQSDALMRSPEPLLAYHTAANVQAQLRSGVTTIRDFGLPGSTGIQAREAVDAGVIPGPRIIAGGDPICITGGHGSNWGAVEADGPVGVTRAVRQQIINGADVLKFMASGGLGTYPEEDPGIPELSPAELAAGIAEAHKFHKRAAAHAYSTESIRNAIEAGVDTVEHGAFMDDETVALMVERGTAHVPTISGLIAIAFQYRMIGQESMARRILTDIIDRLRNSARLTWLAGVPVGTGTDTSGEVVEELELLQEATGAATVDVLRAATSTAAGIAGVGEQTGSLVPGKAADVLVVDGDVLAEGLDVLRRPRWVLRAGAVFEGAPMPLGVRVSMLRGIPQ
ncbi:amidohydrolase family protein [Streptomyces mayteni]